MKLLNRKTYKAWKHRNSIILQTMPYGLYNEEIRWRIHSNYTTNHEIFGVGAVGDDGSSSLIVRWNLKK